MPDVLRRTKPSKSRGFRGLVVVYEIPEILEKVWLGTATKSREIQCFVPRHVRSTFFCILAFTSLCRFDEHWISSTFNTIVNDWTLGTPLLIQLCTCSLSWQVVDSCRLLYQGSSHCASIRKPSAGLSNPSCKTCSTPYTLSMGPVHPCHGPIWALSIGHACRVYPCMSYSTGSMVRYLVAYRVCFTVAWTDQTYQLQVGT